MPQGTGEGRPTRVAAAAEFATLRAALAAYDIGEVLGEGACGVVIAGRHRTLGRDVAIKQLTPGAGRNAALRARFVSEARVLASLDHPHIVPVYDFVEADGTYLLVMERLTGGTVAGRSRAGHLSPQAACAVVVAAATALDHAHTKGVLHRDVKPENLMFSADGVLKVTDFGIAKLIGAQSADVTRTGQLLGTPSFMAPEQITGKEVGPSADVYALGLVLYELLAGELPFPRGDEPLAALYQRVHEEPIPLLERNPHAPPALEDVVAGALRRAPSERHPTAQALAAAIREAAAREWGSGWEASSGVVLRPIPATDRRGSSAPPRPRRRIASAAHLLLERESEVAAIEAALDDACGAAGAVVVLTAPAGMGKTRLMRAAAKLAAQRQMLVLTCRGDELEREFPFGLVRQLFEPALMELDVQARREVLAGAAALAGELLLGGGQPDAPVGEPALDHALYWLAANLATRAPLALLVDDAHWGDGPSLRALRHLVVRLEGLPVAVVVAARPAEPGAAQDVLDRLAGDPLADHVLPAPLSEGAVAILMQEQLSAADDEFARACHVATGGNPFLLSELLGALRAAGIVPIAENAERVRAIGPNTVARSVLLRLKSLPDEAAVLARTLAILGSGASAAQLARAAGVDERTVARVADALVAADILAPGRPLEFVHPIVRTAVYGSLSTFERSAGHTAAARTLHADGASPETVATHLLHSEPAGEPWTVERLREAAVTAMSVGALGATVAYLERALIEPASARERPEILLALSEGHRHQNSWEQAESVLLQTLQEAGDPATRVDAARRLSTLWLPWRRHAKAPDALAPVISDVRDSCPDLARDLELTLSAAMWLDADEAPVWARRVRQDQVSGGGRDRVERVILSRQAWAATVGGELAEVAAALARGALQTGELIIEDARAHGFEMSVVTLALAGHTGEAHDHLDRAMTAARRRGHLGRWAFLSAIAAHVLLLEGRLLDAERHALEALDVLRPDGIAFPASLDALVEALLERGQLAAAAQAYGHLADRAALPDTLLLAGLRLTPARMLSAAGDDRAALERALAIGRRQLQLGRPNPAWCAWRSTAALLHLQLGENEAARVLADEELELARAFGAPRAIGVALRVAGLCRGGQSSLRLLREAVAVLESAGAPLEHARALVDLGALLRRSGERGEPARDPLRRGREIAERLDAQPLATRAHEELLAAGARPRRTALRGIDALTPSERRVCELAAQGLSNRQIAQTLFVTVKTVEGHLTAAYGKLGITRKHEIAAAMGAAPVPAAGAARSR